jgi:hypothetical protein
MVYRIIDQKATLGYATEDNILHWQGSWKEFGCDVLKLLGE